MNLATVIIPVYQPITITHEQVKHHLFEQIRPEFIYTDLKFEQIESIYLLHVYGSY